MDPIRSDFDVPVRTAISKRKVASAPAAPAYKGNFQSCGTIWDGYIAVALVSVTNFIQSMGGWPMELCVRPFTSGICGSVSSQLICIAFNPGFYPDGYPGNPNYKTGKLLCALNWWFSLSRNKKIISKTIQRQKL